LWLPDPGGCDNRLVRKAAIGALDSDPQDAAFTRVIDKILADHLADT
jgi:hypothetical protein